MSKHPTRLAKDPIVEALVEIRFTSVGQVSASELLPGMLYSDLRSTYPEISSAPVANIPQEVRHADPNLVYQPTKRLLGESMIVLIGDRVLSLSCRKPYVGWNEFRPRLLELSEAAKNTGLIESIERFSVKYVNLIPPPITGPFLAALNLKVQLAEHDLVEHGCTVRTEIREGPLLSIVQIVANAQVQFTNSDETLSGTILDVDTIYEIQDSAEDFWANFPDLVETARATEKALFFSILTDETLTSFEPEWD